MSRDIPLAEAMLCWNSGFNGATPSCEVVRHPDETGRSDRYSGSVGACFSYWTTRDQSGQERQLLVEAWHLAAFCAVPIEMVHQALLVIPEYRNLLAYDCLPKQFAHERD